jgi:broad specificity phosphatase PhoE
MRVIVVRHGQPDWSPGGLVSNDPVLTELGHAQAERLVDRRWGKVDHLWVSPFARARQTVAPLEHLLGMEAEVHDWMAEIGPDAAWEGSPIDELEEMFANITRRTISELWEGMPGDGAETFRDFHIRVTEGLQASFAGLGIERLDDSQLWSEGPDETVVLVAHGGTNAVVIGHLLGIEPTPWEWDRFDSAHTSVATMTARPIAHASAFGMMGFGDVTHLDPDMVTR